MLRVLIFILKVYFNTQYYFKLKVLDLNLRSQKRFISTFE